MNTADTIGPWLDMYEAAILEHDTSKLLDRIREAKHAICDRIEELHKAGGSERIALHRAWKALQALEEIHTISPKQLEPQVPPRVRLGCRAWQESD